MLTMNKLLSRHEPICIDWYQYVNFAKICSRKYLNELLKYASRNTYLIVKYKRVG